MAEGPPATGAATNQGDRRCREDAQQKRGGLKRGAKRRLGKTFSRIIGEKMANQMGEFPEAKQVAVKQEMID